MRTSLSGRICSWIASRPPPPLTKPPQRRSPRRRPASAPRPHPWRRRRRDPTAGTLGLGGPGGRDAARRTAPPRHLVLAQKTSVAHQILSVPAKDDLLG